MTPEVPYYVGKRIVDRIALVAHGRQIYIGGEERIGRRGRRRATKRAASAADADLGRYK